LRIIILILLVVVSLVLRTTAALADGEDIDIYQVIEDAQKKAAARYKVPVSLLNAIKGVESKGSPWAICVNLGGGKSNSLYPKSYKEAANYLLAINTDNVDIGPWQVNYYHIGKRAGLSREQMLNPYYSANLAANKLASEIAENGYSWNAVGNYHNRRLERKVPYVAKIKEQMRREGYKIDE
jgi:hypothetical protein